MPICTNDASDMLCISNSNDAISQDINLIFTNEGIVNVISSRNNDTTNDDSTNVSSNSTDIGNDNTNVSDENEVEFTNGVL